MIVLIERFNDYYPNNLLYRLDGKIVVNNLVFDIYIALVIYEYKHVQVRTKFITNTFLWQMIRYEAGCYFFLV